MGRLLRYIVLVSDDLQLAQNHDMLKGRAPAAVALTMTIAEQLRAQGEAKGIAKSVLMIMKARELHVAGAVRQRIEACSDVEMLEYWLVRAATAASAEDIFEA